ncbi:MAG: hypothetical protein ACR2NF_06265 [Pirellulales bacterium]
MSKEPSRANSNAGFIDPDMLYTCEELKKRMRWGDSAFRQARWRGLKTYKKGKCVYVMGEDVITYVTNKDNKAMSK